MIGINRPFALMLAMTAVLTPLAASASPSILKACVLPTPRGQDLSFETRFEIYPNTNRG